MASFLLLLREDFKQYLGPRYEKAPEANLDALVKAIQHYTNHEVSQHKYAAYYNNQNFHRLPLSRLLLRRPPLHPITKYLPARSGVALVAALRTGSHRPRVRTFGRSADLTLCHF
jgi:hypothetical protein